MDNNQTKSSGLNKSLKLIFVYTVATGSIFTFVNYWDSVFYGFCPDDNRDFTSCTGIQ